MAIETPTGKGELILVVEDSDQVRQVTLERLKTLGYDVMEAKSGSEAIKVIESGAPIALVFSDVVMPGLTGYDVAQWVRERKPDLKVLLTSGNEGTARSRAEDAAGPRVLAKPYSLAQLGRAIHDALAPAAGEPH